MSNYPIYKDLDPIILDLNNIFLDPNNPRFMKMNEKAIPYDRIKLSTVQENVIQKLEKSYSIDSLTMNMEINGYLPIDRVIVKKIESNVYVVLEGNRRICAAKNIYNRSKTNSLLFEDEIIDSLKNIPCLEYKGENTEASWIFQGLRHITGIQDWSSFNKAKLLISLMEEEGLSLTEVGKKFGLTAYGAGQWARGYYAFRYSVDSSDYSSEIDEKTYGYFQEIFSRSNAPFREWLEWNESEKTFNNDLNLNEFLSWLYPKDLSEVDESVNENSIRGDWSKRILSRITDTRNISYLIRNSKPRFEEFRTELDIEKAYTGALQEKYKDERERTYNARAEVFEALEICLNKLENLPFKILRDPVEKEKLFGFFVRLEDIIKDIKE